MAAPSIVAPDRDALTEDSLLGDAWTADSPAGDRSVLEIPRHHDDGKRAIRPSVTLGG
jgi:hypothetical protein